MNSYTIGWILNIAGFGALGGVMAHYIPNWTWGQWLAFMGCAIAIDLGAVIKERS